MRRDIQKGTASAAFSLNLVSIVYGVYFIAAQGKAALPTPFGTVMLTALTLNLLLVYLNFARGEAAKLQRWGTAYLVVSMAALAVLGLGGAAATSVYAPRTEVLIHFSLVYPAYLAVLAAGALHARLTGNSASGSAVARAVEPERFTRGRSLLLIILFLILVSGLFNVYILLTDYPGLLQVWVSQSALFIAFFYLALTLWILKVYRKPYCPVSIITGLAGLALFAVFMLPLLLTPLAAKRAEANFSAAFGADWRERLNPSVREHFLQHRFSLPAYFLGTPVGSYNFERDILFYEGTEGVDQGLKLYFDVYRPITTRWDLPGYGSTIIRIHGGAWIAGNKGFANMMQMNKYLASQGYTVFDVQYGLTNLVTLPQIMGLHDFLTSVAGLIPVDAAISGLGAPGHLVGPFTLDDMVRHLGIFTYYLAEHAADYGAPLDSVFVSGGSAGGHLSTAVALAMTGGEHEEIFSPEIQVKGYIPFYPANKAVTVLERIGGSPEWIDVEQLVRADSPPCLIYQGYKDGMVPWETARSFQDRYLQAGNEACAVIYLPLAAHASDFQFTGYYNQLFLFYMERFMVLHQ
jgi:acetyl esterase/lipase